MTSKLLNCPKCGGKAKTQHIFVEDKDDFVTNCSKCGWTKQKRVRRLNRDMAVREWNVCVKEELKENSKPKRIVNTYDIRG